MPEEFQPAPLSGAWDSALLAPVAEINEQMLEYLRLMAAQNPAATVNASVPRLISSMRGHWCRLEGNALRALSACPYLLLDAGFAQRKRWEGASAASVMDAPVRASYFATQTGIALIRRTLLLGWHLARANRVMAGVVLGMTPAAAESIARSQLRHLDALAELAPWWIVPRWEQQPIVWQQLINAACSGHPVSLRQAQLRGLQLLAREQT